MPFLVLVLLGLLAGIAVYLGVLRVPGPGGDPAAAAGAAVADELAASARERPWLRRMLTARLDPNAVTGLALSIALVVAIVGGLVLGALAYLMRSSTALVSLDRAVGSWGHDHATHLSTTLLQGVTDLAGTPATVIVVLLVAAAETLRVRSLTVMPFLVAVVVGEVLIVDAVKHLLDRARPTFDPIAASLGPSFPSGHSARAAALYAAVALVLARRRSPRVRALLFAAAAALAVAVACSRVMLGVHWLSDTVAGVAFGWAWFAVCAIAFGGRLLDFAAPAERAASRAATGDRLGRAR